MFQKCPWKVVWEFGGGGVVVTLHKVWEPVKQVLWWTTDYTVTVQQQVCSVWVRGDTSLQIGHYLCQDQDADIVYQDEDAAGSDTDYKATESKLIVCKVVEHGTV